MSGALRKMGVYLGLVEDGERYNARYDDEYDDFDEYEDEAVDGESHETEPVPAGRESRDVREPRAESTSLRPRGAGRDGQQVSRTTWCRTVPGGYRVGPHHHRAPAQLQRGACHR